MAPRITTILTARTRVTARLIAHVTAVATTERLRVIHARNRAPRGRAVTGIASRCGIDMGGRFTSSNGVVMTTRTTAAHLGVIDAQRRTPPGRGMARFTHIAGRNMAAGFTSCTRPVMTAETTARHTGVIESRR